MNASPLKLGFSMPAEWETHSATLMHWPSNRDTWPGDRLNLVEEVFLNILEVLHRYEPVLLLTDPGATAVAEKRLRERGLSSDQIVLLEQPVNDVWTRDCGPVFLRKEQDGQKEFALTDWEYNAWGDKYPPFEDDNRIPAVIAERYGIRRFLPGMVLEGGAVESNGQGVLLTTESVLLNSNRNPHLAKGEIEQRLRNFLGVTEILWLWRGLKGDDTDGHIDDLCRFLNEKTILTVLAEESNINHPVLEENYRRLRVANEKRDSPFQIETLLLPKTRISGTTVDGSEYVPASYANFYVANGVVLVPLYDSRTDSRAIDLFTHYYPDREVIGIPAGDLVWGQGSFHCITQPLYGLNPASPVIKASDPGSESKKRTKSGVIGSGNHELVLRNSDSC